MAGAAVIGALRVVLGADTAAFEDGLKGAQKKLGDFGAGVAKGAAVAGAAVAALAAAIGVSIKHAIDEADKLGKMAQSIGIPVEELSKLKYAAELSDVSLESLGKSVTILSKKMAAAAVDINGEAAQSFKNLGISVRNSDGTLKSSTEVMTAVADKFAGMKDGVAKTALAVQIFGRAGAEMIPMLNQGAAGLNEMMTEASALGLVINTKTAVAAEAFNDNLKRMGKIKEGIITLVTAQMLPAFLQMSQVMIDTAKNSDIISTAAEGIVTAIRGAVTVALTAVVTFQRLTFELGAFWEVLKSLKTFDPSAIAAAWAAFRDAGAETEARFAGLKEFIEKFWTDSAAAAEVGAAKQTKGLTDIALASTAAANAFQSFIDAQAKSLAAQQAELATIGMAAGAKEQLRIQLAGLAIATANQTKLTTDQEAALNKAALAAGKMALESKGAHLVLAAKEPHELYRAELANNEAALRAFGATGEEIVRVQQTAAEKYGATWGQVGANAAGSFKQLADSFGRESKGMASAGKALGIVQATINAYMGASKALATLPPPMSYVAAAASLAQGLAYVASIKSQSIPSFATGGSFRVPGGLGGGDRKMIPIMAEPGEQIDIWRPGQAGGDPRRAGGSREITVHGLNSPKQLFTQKHMREFAEMLNEAIGDGARLKFA